MKNAASSSPTVTQLERKLAAADAENARLLALMEKKEAQWLHLIETAKANGLSPYDYLQYVFATLPTLNTLLPWQWKETLPV